MQNHFTDGTRSTTAIKIDLLLRHEDGTAIVAEAKVGKATSYDTDAVLALVQALAGATQFATPKQQARLARYYPDYFVAGEHVDVAVLAYHPPKLADATYQQQLDAAARLMAPAGLLLVWEFRHGDEVAGVYVNLVDRRAIYWYLGGFDPSLAQLGIGKVAIAQGIRSSIDAGRSYFDFGAGGEPYKYSYGATDRRAAVFLAGSSSLRSRVGLLAASGARLLRERSAPARPESERR